MTLAAGAGDGLIVAELGAVVLGLAVLARLSSRLGITPVPLYLLGGLAFGAGGVAPLDLSEDFVTLGSEIGVILLLLALGLEYTADDLRTTVRSGARAGLLDIALNFTPGFAAGLLLGWGFEGGVLLGGVTYISSSGVIVKVLADLGRTGNRETPAILGILVLEDIAMAVYLPLVGLLIAPEGSDGVLLGVFVALGALAAVLFVALRHGHVVSRLVASQSDEVLLLSVVGLTLLVAGVAQELQVSSAIGAFLVGIALSGPVSHRAGELIRPLRDLFAATFFLFFGLQVDPGSIPDVAVVALVLAVVTGATKIVTGRWAAARIGVGRAGQARAGTALIARGEFSIVIAGLGVAGTVDPDLGPTAAAYVLLLAVAGPLVTKLWPAGRRAAYPGTRTAASSEAIAERR